MLFRELKPRGQANVGAEANLGFVTPELEYGSSSAGRGSKWFEQHVLATTAPTPVAGTGQSSSLQLVGGNSLRVVRMRTSCGAADAREV